MTVTKSVRASEANGSNSRRSDQTQCSRWFQARSTDSGERGAVLLLAMVFMVASATIIAGLVSWSGNDIKNTGHLKSSRIAMYAAGSAIQIAIWNQRYTIPTSSNVVAQMCPDGTGTSTSPFTLQDNPLAPHLTQAVNVWCGTTATSATAASGWTRQVTMYAYPAGSTACSPVGAPTSCNTNVRPLIKAQINFNDFDPSGHNTCLPGMSGVSCGYGMSIVSWVVAPTT